MSKNRVPGYHPNPLVNHHFPHANGYLWIYKPRFQTHPICLHRLIWLHKTNHGHLPNLLHVISSKIIYTFGVDLFIAASNHYHPPCSIMHHHAPSLFESQKASNKNPNIFIRRKPETYPSSKGASAHCENFAQPMRGITSAGLSASLHPEFGMEGRHISWGYHPHSGSWGQFTNSWLVCFPRFCSLIHGSTSRIPLRGLGSGRFWQWPVEVTQA